MLHLLKETYGQGKRLIVIPWNYSLADGEYYPGSNVRFHKKRQIRILDRLGIDFIPGTGEDGGAYV